MQRQGRKRGTSGPAGNVWERRRDINTGTGQREEIVEQAPESATPGIIGEAQGMEEESTMVTPPTARLLDKDMMESNNTSTTTCQTLQGKQSVPAICWADDWPEEEQRPQPQEPTHVGEVKSEEEWTRLTTQPQMEQQQQPRVPKSGIATTPTHSGSTERMDSEAVTRETQPVVVESQKGRKQRLHKSNEHLPDSKRTRHKASIGSQRLH